MISCLVLGDFYVALDSLSNSGFENTEKSEISVWEREITYKENDIDISFQVPVVSNAPFEDLVQMSDGIIYFLNPSNPEDIQLFKDIINIIQTVRRNIPTIIIIHDKENYIKINGNEILAWIWEQYPFEAWIYDLPKMNPLMDVLKTLIDSIIDGDILINYDTAWMQIPVLKKNANILIENEKWVHAARLVEKIVKIYRKFENDEWTILAEKSAWLYANGRDFLSAAKMIEDFNKNFSQKYRKMYHEELLHIGQRFYKSNKFYDASKQYELAGNWAKLELDDPNLMKKAYTSAIYSWLSACDIPSAFHLFEPFEIHETQEILRGVVEKIAGAADYLSKNNKHELAKSHLYIAIQKYQKVGLFDEVKVLANKTFKILQRILNEHIRSEDPDSAKMVFDEIENIWETFEANVDDIDPLLYQVCNLFIKKRDFQKVDELIPKINSLEIQNQITKAIMDEEEKIKIESKKNKESFEQKAMTILLDYIKCEEKQFENANYLIYEEADKMIQRENYEDAIKYVKKHADWLIGIGKEQIAFNVIEKCLNYCIQGSIIDGFIEHVQRLPEKERKNFLRNSQKDLITKLELLKHQISLQKFEEYIQNIIKIFRSDLLYDEAKYFAIILMERYISEGEVINNLSESDSTKLRNLINLTHKINHLSESHLEEITQNLDQIYSYIIQFYIKEKNLVEARKYSDKIQNKDLASEKYNQIEKIDHKNQSEQVERVKHEKEVEIYSQLLSRLKKLSVEQKIEQDNLLRMRNGLKRFFFDKGLQEIRNENPLEAAEKYREVIKKLIKTKKIELAGITAAVVSMLYLSVKDLYKIEEMIADIDKEMQLSKDIFHETFPVKIIDYLIKMISAKKYQYILPALKLFEVVALFPEEELLLTALVGEELDFKTIVEKHQDSVKTTTEELSSRYKVLLNKLSFEPRLFSKRMALENKYWGKCRDHFAQQNYSEVYQTYLDKIHHLSQRTEDEFVIVSIVMSFLSLLKIRNSKEVIKEFEKFIFQKEKEFPKISDNTAIKLISILLRNYDNLDAIEAIKEILQGLKEKMILFDWEKSLIENLISGLKNKTKKDAQNPQNSEDIHSITDTYSDNSLLQDQIIVLTQEMMELQPTFDEIKEKRLKMVRAYYQNVIDSLSRNDFGSAKETYEKLAKRMARRNDFDRASLMVLLASLSSFKANISVEKIQEQMNNLMKSLGHVRKILDSSFGIKMTNCLIDIKKVNDEGMLMHLNSLLNSLPLLEEEKKLIQ